MTLHASLCRRALQRRITSPKDSVWISDSALAAAFSRFCLVSKTWQRHITSVPGPLESRRRLGKRQLGDLSTFRYSAAPPPWALSGLIDYSQWQWEPPQSPLMLEKNQLAAREKSAQGSIANLVPPWLKELVDDITDDRPPPPPDLYVTPISRSQLFRTELDEYLQTISTAPVDMVTSKSQGLFYTLQQSIALGDIPPSDLPSITGDIWDAMVMRLGDTAVGYRLYRSLCSALVAGMTNSKVFRPDFVDASFWDTLLMRLAELPLNDESCDIFHRILTATSPECHGALKPGILAFLGQTFAAWRSLQPAEPMARAESARPRHQVQQIASGLAAVNPEHHDSLVASANDLAFQKALSSRSGQGTMEYSWLSVLAQMPLVREKVLFGVLVRLSAYEPLTAPDLCSLLITQWTSRGYLTAADRTLRRYETCYAGHQDRALASLALAVFSCHGTSGLRKALNISLWRLLERLDRVDDMAKSLEVLSHNRRVPRQLVEDLSVVSRDHHVALRFHSLYNEHLRRPGDAEWNPALFEKYAEKIVRDPSLPSGTIWKALDIDRLDKRQGDLGSRKARHYGTYGAKRAAIVEKLAGVFGDTASPLHQRNPRLAFRQVSQCVRFLEEVTDVVPPSVIEALYRTVSKDLVEGRPGRTARLRWFLSVVERNHGSHISQECRQALRSWRYRLTQLWLYRRRGGRGTDQKP